MYAYYALFKKPRVYRTQIKSINFYFFRKYTYVEYFIPLVVPSNELVPACLAHRLTHELTHIHLPLGRWH